MKKVSIFISCIRTVIEFVTFGGEQMFIAYNAGKVYAVINENKNQY